MAFAERPVRRVVAGAPLELSTAQNTVFRHVLRGRPEEVWTRLVMGLLDDVIGLPSRVRAVQVCINNVYLYCYTYFKAHVSMIAFVLRKYRYVFSAEFVDHWIVHVGGFLIDLLSGFGLCFRTSRSFTIIVLLAFHCLNSVMFTIGRYTCAYLPYTCYYTWAVTDLTTYLRGAKTRYCFRRVYDRLHSYIA